MSASKTCTLQDIEDFLYQDYEDVYELIADPQHYVFDNFSSPQGQTTSLLLAIKRWMYILDPNNKLLGAYLDGSSVVFVFNSDHRALTLAEVIKIDGLDVTHLSAPFRYLATKTQGGPVSKEVFKQDMENVEVLVRFVHLLMGKVDQQPRDLLDAMKKVCMEIRSGMGTAGVLKRSADQMADKEDHPRTKTSCVGKTVTNATQVVEELVQTVKDTFKRAEEDQKKEISAAANREDTLRGNAVALRADLKKEQSTTARLVRELADEKTKTSRLEGELAAEKTNISYMVHKIAEAKKELAKIFN